MWRSGRAIAGLRTRHEWASQTKNLPKVGEGMPKMMPQKHKTEFFLTNDSKFCVVVTATQGATMFKKNHIFGAILAFKTAFEPLNRTK
jgi:hypothetical protein